MCAQWEEVKCSLGSLICFVFPSKNVAYWRLESYLYTLNIVRTQILESCNLTLNHLHYQTNIKCEMIWKFLLNVLLYTYDQTSSMEGWAMIFLEVQRITPIIRCISILIEMQITPKLSKFILKPNTKQSSQVRVIKKLNRKFSHVWSRDAKFTLFACIDQLMFELLPQLITSMCLMMGVTPDGR